MEAIRQVASAMGDRMLVGAGTVLTAAEAEAAVDAGARFIISPTLDIETIHRTRQLGAISIPGAFTPTEILAAYRNGADISKYFRQALPELNISKNFAGRCHISL